MMATGSDLSLPVLEALLPFLLADATCFLARPIEPDAAAARRGEPG